MFSGQRQTGTVCYVRWKKLVLLAATGFSNAGSWAKEHSIQAHRCEKAEEQNLPGRHLLVAYLKAGCMKQYLLPSIPTWRMRAELLFGGRRWWAPSGWRCWTFADLLAA